MIPLLRREFTVDVPLAQAWQHLTYVERWPSWARHIKKIDVSPAGELGPKSSGVIHLNNGVKSIFNMTEFNPGRNWKWTGSFLWLKVDYDHRFQELNSLQTQLVWIVEAEGFGVSLFGNLFAKIYNGNLNKAIPLLIRELLDPGSPG